MPGVSRGPQCCFVFLGALERFMNWKAGLQESQPGFSAVFKLIRPGDPVLDNTKPVHTDVSLPLTPLSRVMESCLFVTIQSSAPAGRPV